MRQLQRRSAGRALLRYGRNRRVWLVGLLVTVVFAGVGLTVVPAMAVSGTGDYGADCLAAASGSLSFQQTSLRAGQSTAVTWRANLTNECFMAQVNAALVLRGRDLVHGWDLLVPPINLAIGGGTLTTPLPASGKWSLEFAVTNRMVQRLTKVLGVATVTVDQPVPLADPQVDIRASGTAEREKFVRAMATPNAVVRVAGDVNLDLTGVGLIPVAAGVQLMGDRTVNPTGPRLFTTTFANAMFVISADTPGGPADGVRISGLRLDGGEGDDAHPYAGLGFDEDAILINSAQHVEIDHNEIYHWHGAAVHVEDDLHADGQPGRINRDNADTVRVHDNFIHDNQHPTASDFGPAAHRLSARPRRQRRHGYRALPEFPMHEHHPDYR